MSEMINNIFIIYRLSTGTRRGIIYDDDFVRKLIRLRREERGLFAAALIAVVTAVRARPGDMYSFMNRMPDRRMNTPGSGFILARNGKNAPDTYFIYTGKVY